jgi:hypothetical protein
VGFVGVAEFGDDAAEVVEEDAVLVRCDLNEVDRVVAEEAEGEVVGRDVDEGRVAGLEDEVGGQVEALGGAARDEDLRGRGGARIGLSQAVGDELDEWGWALCVAVGEGGGAVGVEDAVGGGAELLDGEEGGIGHAPGQVDDAGFDGELGQGRRDHAASLQRAERPLSASSLPRYRSVR